MPSQAVNLFEELVQVLSQLVGIIARGAFVSNFRLVVQPGGY